MEWDLVTHNEDRYLEVVTHGVVDSDCTVNMARAIAQAMKSQRVTRVLIDHRNVAEVVGSISATYNRPKMFRFIGIALGVRIAELIRPEHEFHFKFFEKICFDQGYRLSVFEDKDKALTWLLS